ncbi:hypothetical protein QTP88_026949 [Uroleucon formosanum]
MSNEETQYDMAVRCTIDNGKDGIIEVFLSRTIVVSDEQEALYNADGNQTLSLVASWLSIIQVWPIWHPPVE